MKSLLRNIIKKSIEFELSDHVVVLDPPNNINCHYSCNLFHVHNRLSNSVRENIIKNIIDMSNGIVYDIKIEKNFFMNIYISNNGFKDELSNLFNNIDSTLKSNKNHVIIEYCSANPTGPLHIGNGRGIVIADVLYNLLNSELEYYVNNMGTQIDLLKKSLYSILLKQLNLTTDFSEDLYYGEFYENILKDIILGNNNNTPSPNIYYDRQDNNIEDSICDNAISLILKNILKSAFKLSTWFYETFDEYGDNTSIFFESDLDDLIYDNIFKNTLKHLTYYKSNNLYLKTSLFGDDKDRVIYKKHTTDKYTSTYFMNDILYHMKKFEYHDTVINIFGHDHVGHEKRLRSVLNILHIPQDRLKIILTGMVKLIKDNKIVEMSKRSGNYITLDFLMDEIGVDATRLTYLLYNPDSSINFDINLAKKREKENHVYYIQYAYVRCKKIIEKINKFNDKIDKFDNDDIILIKKMLDFVYVLNKSIETLSPHLIAIYLYELSKIFHSYYEKEKILGNSTKEYIIHMLAILYEKCFNLLRISVPNEM